MMVLLCLCSQGYLLTLLLSSTLLLSIMPAGQGFSGSMFTPSISMSAVIGGMESQYSELLKELLSNPLVKNAHVMYGKHGVDGNDVVTDAGDDGNNIHSNGFLTHEFIGNMSSRMIHQLNSSMPSQPDGTEVDDNHMKIKISIVSDQRLVVNDDHHLNIHHEASFTAPFECVSFPVEYSPFSFCSGVVDYPFVLWNGLSLNDLEVAARSSAATLNAFMGAPCLSDLKKLICANVYLQCVDRVDPVDPSTYQTVGLNKILPYKRPCKSLCTAVGASGTSCHGLLEAFGTGMNCSAINPYSGIVQYDDSNDPTMCNGLTTTASVQVVAGSAEPYIGNWCSQVITDVYVPSSDTINSALAPLLPPFVMQMILEGVLGSIEAVVPMSFPGDCLTSQRKLMCGLLFMKPVAIDDLAFLFGTVYLPAFPARELCMSYEESCASSLLALVPSASMNCTGVKNNVELYPDKPQTIVSLNLGFGPINLITSPNTLSESSLNLQTECPRGFNIPDYPDSTGTQMIPYSGCAMECPGHFFPNDEISSFHLIKKVTVWICVVLGFGQIVNLYVTDRTKRNIFVTLQLIANLVITLYDVIQYTVIPNPHDFICSSKTSFHTLDAFEGQTAKQTMLAHNCAAYGIIGLAADYLQFWVAFAVFAELWLRVVMGVKDVKYYRRFYFWGLLIVDFGNFLISVFFRDPVPAPIGVMLQCIWAPPDRMDSYFSQGLPHTIHFGLGICLACHVVYHCILVSTRVSNGDSNPLAKLWKSYRILFLFTIILFFFYFPIIVYYANYFVLVLLPKVTVSFLDWTVCTFIQFHNSQDLGYIETCGAYLSFAYNIMQFDLMRIVFSIEAALLFWITLNSDARAFWHSLYLRYIKSHEVKIFVAEAKRHSIIESSSAEDKDRRPSVVEHLKHITNRLKPGGHDESPEYSIRGTWASTALHAVTSVFANSVMLKKEFKVHPLQSKYIISSDKKLSDCPVDVGNAIEGGIPMVDVESGNDGTVEEDSASPDGAQVWNASLSTNEENSIHRNRAFQASRSIRSTAGQFSTLENCPTVDVARVQECRNVEQFQACRYESLIVQEQNGQLLPGESSYIAGHDDRRLSVNTTCNSLRYVSAIQPCSVDAFGAALMVAVDSLANEFDSSVGSFANSNFLEDSIRSRIILPPIAASMNGEESAVGIQNANAPGGLEADIASAPRRVLHARATMLAPQRLPVGNTNDGYQASDALSGDGDGDGYGNDNRGLELLDLMEQVGMLGP